MGISRSASVIVAYAMKAYDWDLTQALKHVKNKRNCIKPNTNFVSQLETYQGILYAMKNREKLQRSKSETNLEKKVIIISYLLIYCISLNTLGLRLIDLIMKGARDL